MVMTKTNDQPRKTKLLPLLYFRTQTIFKIYMHSMICSEMNGAKWGGGAVAQNQSKYINT